MGAGKDGCGGKCIVHFVCSILRGKEGTTHMVSPCLWSAEHNHNWLFLGVLFDAFLPQLNVGCKTAGPISGFFSCISC